MSRFVPAYVTQCSRIAFGNNTVKWCSAYHHLSHTKAANDSEYDDKVVFCSNSTLHPAGFSQVQWPLTDVVKWSLPHKAIFQPSSFAMSVILEPCFGSRFELLSWKAIIISFLFSA